MNRTLALGFVRKREFECVDGLPRQHGHQHGCLDAASDDADAEILIVRQRRTNSDRSRRRRVWQHIYFRGVEHRRQWNRAESAAIAREGPCQTVSSWYHSSRYHRRRRRFKGRSQRIRVCTGHGIVGGNELSHAHAGDRWKA